MKIFLVLKMHKLTANLVNTRETSCLTITMSRNQPKLGKNQSKAKEYLHSLNTLSRV